MEQTEKLLDLTKVKRELLQLYFHCELCGLVASKQWAAELLLALKDVKQVSVAEVRTEVYRSVDDCFEEYAFARSCLDRGEYLRAAFYTERFRNEPPENSTMYFINVYARYMAGEKRAADSKADIFAQDNSEDVSHLHELRDELEARATDKSNSVVSSFLSWLRGKMLKKLRCFDEAVEALVESVTLFSGNWLSYSELIDIVRFRHELDRLLARLPQFVPPNASAAAVGAASSRATEHTVQVHFEREQMRDRATRGWMISLFAAHAFNRVGAHEEARRTFEQLLESGFARSAYVRTALACTFEQLRVVADGVRLFQEVRRADPFQLDSLDVYSNLLFIQQDRVELAAVAHELVEVDKYRYEVCVVIANYYGLRGEHERAIQYFQRALRLNPSCAAAWCLLGHEMLELKNVDGATYAYRRAVDAAPNEYRAWYGLGQAYEMLSLSNYALHYHSIAFSIRPHDSRTAMALADTYARLSRFAEAKKAYMRAYLVGDEEGIALLKLARLYELLKEKEEAASVYGEYIRACEQDNKQSALAALPGAATKYVHGNNEDLVAAYCFLAKFHTEAERRNLESAQRNVAKWIELGIRVDEAKSLLRQIQALRISAEHVDPAASTSGCANATRTALNAGRTIASPNDAQPPPESSSVHDDTTMHDETL